MIPASFDYLRAGSADEAVSLLSEHGDEAKLLAGGQSLLPLMKLRLANPAVVIDTARIRELSFIREDGEDLVLGALTRHCDLAGSDLVRHHAPLLAHAASQVGDPQIRHRGTLGGSLAHGDPASDLPAAVLALGGTLVIKGAHGQRNVVATEFFRGFLETAVEPDEMLTEIRVPKASDAAWSFQKFTRRASDWAIVGVAAVQRDSLSVALVNMGSVPMRATDVEEAARQGADLQAAAQLAASNTEPPADLNASAEYRRHLARVLVGRALTAMSHGQQQIT